MDIKDIIELSKNGFTPADIKDLISTMNEKPEADPEPAAPEPEAQEPAAQEPAAAEPEQASEKTQELIDAIRDLKRSIQASNIRKDTGAAQTQNVEDVLASLVR